MKKGAPVIVVLSLLLASPVYAVEREFNIDAAHSSLSFKIRHLYTMFAGRFNSFSGTITGDPDDPSSLKVMAKVDVGSVDTANDGRDRHLRVADFFNTELHPLATFESTKALVGEDNTGSITGNLAIRGVTKEVTFTGKFLGYGVDHRGGHRAGFHARTRISRSDFGVSYNAKLPSGITVLGEEVELILDIEAIEVEPKEDARTRKTLAQEIAQFKSKQKKQLPEEVLRALEKANAEIMARGGVDGLQVGRKAPDFSLPDMNGKKVWLSRKLKSGPVVVVFYRGEWCPFCNLQLKALEDAYPRIRKLGASLIGIAPQKQEKALLQQKTNRLSFPLLTDATGKTMRDYRLLYQIPEQMKKVFLEQYNINLAEYNGEDRWELPVTATYVVDTDGVIRAGMVDMDYTKRMEPNDIIEILEDMKERSPADAGSRSATEVR